MMSPDSRDNYARITTLLELYLQRAILRVYCMSQYLNERGTSRVYKIEVFSLTPTPLMQKGVPI